MARFYHLCAQGVARIVGVGNFGSTVFLPCASNLSIIKYLVHYAKI